ncbi:flagellar hook-associated protein 2 [Peribacillus loiseleuriae]|uniref:flagellar hook-associated protein 2 n=1 Tax=Peribacillus loiseleuriae TaxID=1679170 RepID=UPI0037F2C5BC
MVRVSGLSSGMDIDELVKSMMQAARVPMDKLTQKKTYSEWQRDDYRSMNTALLELDTLIRDGVGKQASFIKKTVTVSNPNALSVKNINSTSDFSGSIEVKELATHARIISKISPNKSDSEEKLDPTKKLSEVFGVLNDEEKTIKISAITKDGTMDTKEITIDPEKDSLNDVISKINSQTGVTAFYDSVSNQISFTAKNTGDYFNSKTDEDEPEIKLEGTFFSNQLNMKVLDNKAAAASQDEGTTGTLGSNAELTYNGIPIKRSSNTFTINGVELTIKEKATGPITFSSTTDVDAILDTVTKFVTKYNEVIEKIKDKTGESKYRSFTPLTAEQKKAMTEDEVKLWEEKAKSGTLKNDSTLKNLLTTMRSSLNTSVNGLNGMNSLSMLGITTTSNYLDGGKLTIDEDKLRAAISEDPNAIYNLFMKEDSDTGEMGLARRLRTNLKASMATITEQAGKAGSLNNNFTIGKSLNSLETRISAFEAKLMKLETRYYTQFTAMEKAIQRANSQSASLMQYFS